MKNYVTPEFEIILVNITDVIATSGGEDSSVDTDIIDGVDIEVDASEIFS